MFLNTVLSVRSRCNLDNGSLAEGVQNGICNSLNSEFSSQSGLLCVASLMILFLPLYFLFEIFHGNIGQISLSKSMIMVFILFKASKMLQSDRNVRFVSGKEWV
jgi:hypothetical protein